MLKYFLITIFYLSITPSSFGQGFTQKDTLTTTFLGTHFSFLIERNLVKSTVSKLRDDQKLDYGSFMIEQLALKQNIETIQKEYKLPDWLLYQLIRRIAEQINSKYIDYTNYTLTKYLLLIAVGFEPLIFTSSDKILLYVKSTDTVFNLPNKIVNGKQYICLNYHDYGHQINFGIEKFYQSNVDITLTGKDFHYTINYLPSFQKESYIEKKISFRYNKKLEYYTILVSPEMQDYFTNYPVTEYRYQINIPFSEIAYNKLIPELKKRTKNLSTEKGVEYLMLFVRDGFEFETDTKLFGREKRLSAEETLAYNSSDCEDRSALFFLLIKEIYNLPMAVISYPEHVNVGVLLPKSKGISITIENQIFTICEPTPQKKKRGIGWMPKEIRKQPFEIAYTYKQ